MITKAEILLMEGKIEKIELENERTNEIYSLSNEQLNFLPDEDHFFGNIYLKTEEVLIVYYDEFQEIPRRLLPLIIDSEENNTFFQIKDKSIGIIDDEIYVKIDENKFRIANFTESDLYFETLDKEFDT